MEYVPVVELEQTDLTVLPDSISYYENYILKQLDDVLLQYTNSSNLLNYHYPVGSIIEVLKADYDPNGQLPGVWTRFGEGRTMISTGGDNSLLETSIGTFKHLLTIDQIPSHTHRLGYNNEEARQRRASSWTEVCQGSGYSESYITMSTGGDVAHNNVQPYIVTFNWKRVS